MKLQAPDARIFRHDEFGTCRAHLSRAGVRRLAALKRVGTYRFAGAIRPDPAVEQSPMEGYRVEPAEDGLWRIIASVSAEKLIDLLLDCTSRLSSQVFAVIEDAWASGGADFEEYFSVEMDLCVLQSYLFEFGPLVLDDGFLGVSVFDKSVADEIRLDVHKNLQILTDEVGRYSPILRRFGLAHLPELRLVSESPHYHCTVPDRERSLDLFKVWLHAEPDPLVHDE
ncbi:MAG: hypothetical protein RL885_13935 [Planctomycetota bacterium]